MAKALGTHGMVPLGRDDEQEAGLLCMPELLQCRNTWVLCSSSCEPSCLFVLPSFSCPANANNIVSVCSAVGGSALLATVIYDFMQWHVFIISHNRLCSSGSGYKTLLMDKKGAME